MIPDKRLDRVPTCVVVVGLPGAGKTRTLEKVAQEAARINWPLRVLDVDRIETPPVDEDSSSILATKARYEIMHSELQTSLEAGYDGIVGAVYSDEIAKRRPQEIAEAAGARFVVVQLVAPLSILERRMRGRKATNPSPLRKISELHRVISRFEPFVDPPPIEVDTSITTVRQTVGLIFSQLK